MPLVRVQTNATVAEPDRAALMSDLSACAARVLKKPEAYVMVVVEPSLSVLMAGANGPAALIEVRAIGTIGNADASTATEELTAIVERRLGVTKERVFVTFAGVPGAMWGHAGETFG